MFPTPPSMDIRGWKEINSLNGAQWSLLWEYIANNIWVAVSIFLASIAVTYASVKVYDLPIRAWLSEKFIYHKKISILFITVLLIE